MRLIFAITVAALFGFAHAEDATTPPQPTPPMTAQPAKPDAAKPAAPMPPPAMVQRSSMMPRSDSSPTDMLARMFPGLGLDSPKSVRWDLMLYGMDKRFLTGLQIGSIENPGAVDFPGQPGWLVEEVLTVPAEQMQGLHAVRQEYEVERKKLEQEVLDFNKAEAEKLRSLRLKYEQKANETLPPELREAKQKFDALRDELVANKKAMVAEVLGADGAVVSSQGMLVANKLREALARVVSEIEPKFLELVPAEAKSRIESIIKQQAINRERVGQPFSSGRGPLPQSKQLVQPNPVVAQPDSGQAAPSAAQQAKAPPYAPQPAVAPAAVRPVNPPNNP